LERARKRLDKRAKKGFRGYPVATVALYGPDDTMATKLTVGIVPAENAEATHLQRWFSEGSDIRNDVDVAEEVLAFIADTGAKSVVMTDRIIGCPHEEGIDYEGSTCPNCPFWAAGLASVYSRRPRPHLLAPVAKLATRADKVPDCGSWCAQAGRIRNPNCLATTVDPPHDDFGTKRGEWADGAGHRMADEDARDPQCRLRLFRLE
jgi:hypothetical protein